MGRNRLYSSIVTLWSLVATTVLVAPMLTTMPFASQVATGTDAGAAPPEMEAVPAEQVAAAPAGGPQEGIQVHGAWTIDVREPDGTLVEHREFENAFQNP